MRSFRSLIFVGLAVLASAIFYTVPAAAAPVDPGIYVLHYDELSASLADFSAAVHKAVVQREAAAFLSSDGINPGGTGGQRTPFRLSPEYAASYDTNGHSIDLRRRC